MKIYTRGGDKGKTSVLGARVEKTDKRIEAIGSIDELNSAIGLAIYHARQEQLADIVTDLTVISHQLFDYGADLANVKKEIPLKISTQHTTQLEAKIDAYTEIVGPLTQFVLPGGCLTSCSLHLCRTEARKAERRLNEMDPSASSELKTYINRLSDYLFTVARLANKQTGVDDVAYEGEKQLES